MKQTILAFLVVVLGAGMAWAVVSRGNGPFTINWEVTPKRTIEGRVYNEYHNPMMRIRLLVEALDASDRVVDKTFGDVFGVVGPLSDRYFVVSKLPPADHYRVSVESYTSLEAGGVGPSVR
jgi:hypothetical protein